MKIENQYPKINPDTPIKSRCRGCRRPKLTVEEKIDIIYKVFVAYEYMKDVAKEFRVSMNVV